MLKSLVDTIKAENQLTPKMSETNYVINPHCQIRASNDTEAIESWLNEVKNSHTKIAYTREAKRLLTWCVFIQGKQFHALKKEDFQAYFNFLQSPAKKWQQLSIDIKTQDKVVKSYPFKNPLGQQALAKAFNIIKALMNYLTQANYLAFNPMLLLKQKNIVSSKTDKAYTSMARILNEDEWQAIQHTLNELPDKEKAQLDFKHKVHFLCAMLYFLGLRIDEFATHTWESFVEQEGAWWFYVKGKGDKKSHLPVHPQLLTVIKNYRLYIGLESELPDGEGFAYLLSRKTKQGLSYSQLYQLIKQIGQMTICKFPAKSASRDRLNRLSPHWLRHLFASHLDKTGVTYHLIQRLLRHKTADITKVYLHEDNQRLIEAVERLQWGVKPIIKQAIVQPILHITIRPNAGQGLLFERFLQSLEQVILKEISYQACYNKSSLLSELRNNTLCGKSFELRYRLTEKLPEEKEVFLTEAILQAADIRLLKCSVRLAEESLENYEYR